MTGWLPSHPKWPFPRPFQWCRIWHTWLSHLPELRFGYGWKRTKCQDLLYTIVLFLATGHEIINAQAWDEEDGIKASVRGHMICLVTKREGDEAWVIIQSGTFLSVEEDQVHLEANPWMPQQNIVIERHVVTVRLHWLYNCWGREVKLIISKFWNVTPEIKTRNDQNRFFFLHVWGYMKCGCLMHCLIVMHTKLVQAVL